VTDRLIALGIFGAAHGVRGEIRIKSYTADPKAIGGYGPLTDAAGAKRFDVKVLRLVRDDLVIARVADVTSPEIAATLTGVELFARRAQLPPPDAEEFYIDDLIGLVAVSLEGERFGRVTGMLNHGAGDIMEIAPAAGGDTLLLPFTRQVAPEIDFAAGRIVVVPPPEIEGETPSES
jgi:16S rRNA processing protein RimM